MIYDCLKPYYRTFEFMRGKYDPDNDEFIMDLTSPIIFYEGLINEDLSHLQNSNIDLTDINYSLIFNTTLFRVDKNDFVKLNGEWYKVSKILKYRHPLSNRYGTFEVLI